MKKLDLALIETNGVLNTAHFFVISVGVSRYCFAMEFPDEKDEIIFHGIIEALTSIRGYKLVPIAVKCYQIDQFVRQF